MLWTLPGPWYFVKAAQDKSEEWSRGVALSVNQQTLGNAYSSSTGICREQDRR